MGETPGPQRLNMEDPGLVQTDKVVLGPQKPDVELRQDIPDEE